MLKLCHLILLNVGLFSPVKPEKCFTEDKFCKLDSYNLIEVLTDIPNISECEEICKETSECQYFTYHDDQMIPSHYQRCYLFRLCNTMTDFPKAYTGFTGLCTCSLEVEPQDGHLVKELFAETEIECKLACQENTDCEMYTFYEPNADCELLSGVSSFGKSPLQGFYTGPQHFKSENGICTFSLLDNNNHVMLLDTKDDLIVRSGMLDCTINVSIVIIGKEGRNMGDFGGGACGSGYVNNTVTTLYPASSINVLFNQDGSVTVATNDVVILNTMGGKEGTSNHGGDGYSGGSYGFGITGGMDGGNANCTQCGKGQGIDIQKLSSPHFILSPGPGGSSSRENGGGGVLVNGLGPVDDISFGMGGGYNQRSQNGFAIFEIVQ